MGAAERLTKASESVVIKCRECDVSEADTEKALATIRLVAVMGDPSSETQYITPEAARKLYELQEEILRDDVLASKISWAASRRAPAREPQTVKSAPLHDALRAALDLVDEHAKDSRVQTRPLWYWVVAVSAADARMLDYPARVPVEVGDLDDGRTAAKT